MTRRPAVVLTNSNNRKDKEDKKMKRASKLLSLLLAAVLLGLAALGECLFLLLHRDSGPMAAAFLVLLLASGALLLGCRRLLGKLHWERL